MARRTPLTADEALERLEELCMRSEQCTADARRKLWTWQVPSDRANEVIDSLIERKFIDDGRFARAFVSDRYRFAGWGRSKLRAALMNKNMSQAFISQAMEVIDPVTYQMAAFNALRSKLRSIDRTDMRRCRERLLRFGISRGYETDLVIRIINSRRLWLQE